MLITKLLLLPAAFVNGAVLGLAMAGLATATAVCCCCRPAKDRIEDDRANHEEAKPNG